MTALAGVIAARIRATGPMSLADYMATCLMDPRHGYYATRDPFGAGGDFTTAPEISQMFGELTGLCLAQAWLDQGAPAPFTLAETGPGRGTLMADFLRATRAVPTASSIFASRAARTSSRRSSTCAASTTSSAAAASACSSGPTSPLASTPSRSSAPRHLSS